MSEGWKTLGDYFQPLQAEEQAQQIADNRMQQRIRALQLADVARQMGAQQAMGQFKQDNQLMGALGYGQQQQQPQMPQQAPQQALQQQPMANPQSMQPPSPEQVAQSMGMGRYKLMSQELAKAAKAGDMEKVNQINGSMKKDPMVQDIAKKSLPAIFLTSPEYSGDEETGEMTVKASIDLTDAHEMVENLAKIPGGEQLRALVEKNPGKYTLELVKPKEGQAYLKPPVKIPEDLDRELKKARIGAINSKSSGLVAGSPAGFGPTDEGLKLQADMVLDGSKPPAFGMDKSTRSRFMTILAQSAKQRGMSSKDILASRARLEATFKEQDKLQTLRGPIMANELTAEKNLDQVLKLSNKVGRSGVPVFNKWMLAGRKATGDPEVSAFNASVEVAINEAAKVLSGASGGSVTTDAAKSEVREMLNSAMTKEQVSSVINQLKTDMKNRASAFDERISKTQSDITGKAGKVSKADPLGLGI